MNHFIYILINPSMQGLLKIGKSKRSAQERADELSLATGVPAKFQVAYELEVTDCDLAEMQVHRAFTRYRVENNREFFQLPLHRAIEEMNNIILNNNLDVVSIKVHPYKFDFKYYDNVSNLASDIFSNIDHWNQSKIHFEKGYLQDWLKRKKEHDAIIRLDLANNQDATIAFKLSALLHSLIPEKTCKFCNITISDYDSLQNLLTDPNLKLLLLNGEIADFYGGFLFAKKIESNRFHKTLKFIKENGIHDNIEEKSKNISLLISWHKTSDFYYTGSIQYDQLKYLVSKSQIQIISKEFVLPFSFVNQLNDNENYFSFAQEYFREGKFLVKKYGHSYSRFITHNTYNNLLSNYIIPRSYLINIENDTLDVYFEKVIKLIYLKGNYYPKIKLYSDFHFNENMESYIKDNDLLPLLAKSDIEKYKDSLILSDLLKQCLSTDIFFIYSMCVDFFNYIIDYDNWYQIDGNIKTHLRIDQYFKIFSNSIFLKNLHFHYNSKTGFSLFLKNLYLNNSGSDINPSHFFYPLITYDPYGPNASIHSLFLVRYDYSRASNFRIENYISAEYIDNLEYFDGKTNIKDEIFKCVLLFLMAKYFYNEFIIIKNIHEISIESKKEDYLNLIHQTIPSLVISNGNNENGITQLHIIYVLVKYLIPSIKINHILYNYVYRSNPSFFQFQINSFCDLQNLDLSMHSIFKYGIYRKYGYPNESSIKFELLFFKNLTLLLFREFDIKDRELKLLKLNETTITDEINANNHLPAIIQKSLKSEDILEIEAGLDFVYLLINSNKGFLYDSNIRYLLKYVVLPDTILSNLTLFEPKGKLSKENIKDLYGAYDSIISFLISINVIMPLSELSKCFVLIKKDALLNINGRTIILNNLSQFEIAEISNNIHYESLSWLTFYRSNYVITKSMVDNYNKSMPSSSVKYLNDQFPLSVNNYKTLHSIYVNLIDKIIDVKIDYIIESFPSILKTVGKDHFPVKLKNSLIQIRKVERIANSQEVKNIDELYDICKSLHTKYSFFVSFLNRKKIRDLINSFKIQ